METRGYWEVTRFIVAVIIDAAVTCWSTERGGQSWQLGSLRGSTAAGVESRGLVSRKIRGFAYIIMKYLPLISAHLSFRSSCL